MHEQEEFLHQAEQLVIRAKRGEAAPKEPKEGEGRSTRAESIESRHASVTEPPAQTRASSTLTSEPSSPIDKSEIPKSGVSAKPAEPPHQKPEATKSTTPPKAVEPSSSQHPESKPKPTPPSEAKPKVAQLPPETIAEHPQGPVHGTTAPQKDLPSPLSFATGTTPEHQKKADPSLVTQVSIESVSCCY